MDRDLGHWERELAQETVGGTQISITATLDGHHRAGHPGPEYRWIEATDRYTLQRRDQVMADNAPVEIIGQRPASFTRTLFDESSGRAALDAIQASSCVEGDAVVFRTHDPGAPRRDASAPWEILFLRDGFAVHSALPGDATRCGDAARKAPGWEAWRRESAADRALCKRVLKRGHLEDGVRCLFRSATSGRAAVEVLNLRDKKTVDALYRVLEPDIHWDAQKWNALEIAAAVAATPQARRAGLVERTTSFCADPAHDCAPWRVEFIGRTAAGLGPESCHRLLTLATEQLDAAGQGPAKRALAIVKGIHACAPVEDTKAFMRAALRRASREDLVLKGPGDAAYSIVDSDCQDRSLAPVFERGTPGALCQSLPRFAGSWLARHCDPEAVAVALDIAKAAPSPLDPRTDMVLDGALRVLGACDPRAFEEALAREPDHSPTVAIADNRGKTKLREIFLRKQP